MTAEQKLKLIQEKARIIGRSRKVDEVDLAGWAIEALAKHGKLDDDAPLSDEDTEERREWSFRAWLSRVFLNAHRKAVVALRKFPQSAPEEDISPVYEVDHIKLEQSAMFMIYYNSLSEKDQEAIEAKICSDEKLTGAQRARLARLRKRFPVKLLEMLLPVLLVVMALLLLHARVASAVEAPSRPVSAGSDGQICSQTCSEGNGGSKVA